jgi:hypothetical protein
MQLDGDRSSSLADMRRDVEAAAALERAAIADLKGQASTPVSLPAIEELTQRVTSLADLLEAEDPERAREVLRRYLRGGQIVLTPEDGVYVARGEIFPLQIALSDGGSGNLRCLEVVARGRNFTWTTGFTVAIEVRVA